MALTPLDGLKAWAHARRAVARDRRDAKHEPETPFIHALLAKDDICLHVGASEGRHARVMAMAAPRGRVFCFEPNSYSFAALRHFLRMHGLKNVETIHAAVSDAPGEVVLNVPVKTSGREGRSFGVIGERVARSEVAASGMRRERVRALTLDGFAADRRLARADFIRMDIEGAEALALAGAAGLIDAHKPSILLEIHSVSLKENFGSSAQAVVQMLTGRGYRMFGLKGGALAETSAYDTPAPWKDFFFIHPARAGRLPQGVFRTLMGWPERRLTP